VIASSVVMFAKLVSSADMFVSFHVLIMILIIREAILWINLDISGWDSVNSQGSFIF